MGDIINLRQARKAKRRVEAESMADVNRAKHGRSKADKHLADKAKQKYDAAIDGARREQLES
jgi:hypothetical protein